MKKDMNTFLEILIAKKASDIHISANSPPKIRIDEKLVNVDEDIIYPEDTKNLAYSMLSKEQISIFERTKELDFSFELAKKGRFRINVFFQRGNVGIAVRLIPYYIMNFDECGLPSEIVTSLCRKPKGLVLITGATGMGKSTSLASMVDFINGERDCHIVTVEDPIEFVHTNKRSIIDQREVHYDTLSFGSALKHVLRQDPDVILIGEMRDLETIESALVIAETGHLVFATLHTSDSIQTINRVIDVFPAHQQQQIRTQLSFVLLGVLSQQLIPKQKPPGRVLATEVLIVTPAIKSLIRESKIHQVYSSMQTGQRDGMRTMNQALYELHKKGLVSYEECFARSTDTEDLARLFKK